MSTRYSVNLGKKDKNHDPIKKWAKANEYTWVDTYSLGDGFGDAIIVSKTRIPVALEIKMPGEKLTEAEKKFKQSYTGPYAIVYSPQDLSEVMSYWDDQQIETVPFGIPY